MSAHKLGPSTDFWDIFDRYLAGEATPAEIASVRSYLDDLTGAPGGGGSLAPQDVRVHVKASMIDTAPVVSERWQEFQNYISTSSVTAPTSDVRQVPDTIGISSTAVTRTAAGARGTTGIPSIRQYSRNWSVALGVGFAAVIGLVAVEPLRDKIMQWSGAGPDTQSSIVYTTSSGEQNTVTLDDGSVIVLNVASRMEVFNNAQGRTVVLDGEAMFNVMPDSKRPFIVKTHDVHTTVLGTEFGVRAYGDSEIVVAVRSGKVSVEACKGESGLSHREACRNSDDPSSVKPIEPVVLSAYQMIVAGNESSWKLATGEQIDNALAFAEGRLMLDNMPLLEALPSLNRWYGVDIRVTDLQLGKTPLKGSLPHGTIEDLEQALKVTLNASVVRSGRVITISRGNQ